MGQEFSPYVSRNYLLSIYYMQDAGVEWLIEVLVFGVYKSVGMGGDINLIAPGSPQCCWGKAKKAKQELTRGQDGILPMTLSCSDTCTLTLGLSPVCTANILTPYRLSKFICHSPLINLPTQVLISLLSYPPNTESISAWGSKQEPFSLPGATPAALCLWWPQPPGTSSKSLPPVAALQACGPLMVISMETLTMDGH